MAFGRLRKNRTTLFAYAVVGSIGFVVDASLLTVLTTWFSVGLLPARCVSFSAATVATWLLNRTAVFPRSNLDDACLAEEYGRYLPIQVSGALTNLAVFFVLIEISPALGRTPVLPLAAGALAALAVTYGGARRFVFA